MSNRKNSKESIGKRISALREAHSLSASALARILSVTPAAIWHWEHLGTTPRPEKLNLIAQTFKVTRAYLETGDQSIGPRQEKQEQPAATSLLEQPCLEELMRAIQNLGFDVYVTPKTTRKIVSESNHDPALLTVLNGR